MSLKKICLLVADNGGAPVMELKSVKAKSFLECLAAYACGVTCVVRLSHWGITAGFDATGKCVGVAGFGLSNVLSSEPKVAGLPVDDQ